MEAPLYINVGTTDDSIATALKLVKVRTDGVGGSNAGASIDFHAENADGGAYHQKTARIAGYTSNATGGGSFDGGLKFYTNDAETDQLALTIKNDKSATFAGDVLPSADNSHDLGAAVGGRWANLYTADIHLNNEGSEGNEVDGTTGNWNIQEGEDDLYLLNRKSGKKYRFKLEEIE